MESPNWLRLVTVGLVLAAMAVGYFLLSNRFVSNKSENQENTQMVEETNTPSPDPVNVIVQGSPTSSVSATSQPTSSPRAVASPSPSTSTPPAYSALADRSSKGGVQTLPATGSELLLIGIISLSAIATGLGLRKFPH